jgi:4-aminobutyrate aminotransferase
MGKRLLAGLRELMREHPLIGDVRGKGLMLGVELVRSRESREPAGREAAMLAYRCFELGLLVIYCGLAGNVIEMTPPLTLTGSDVDEGLATLDRALADVESGTVDPAKVERFAGW